jgi:glucose-6-phosphate-specific signal transduction histidine kinase
MKRYERGMMRVVFVFFGMHAVLGIVEFAYTGFLFNTTDPTQFKMIRSMLVALAPFFIFVVGNWSITSLMDGKGKFKEIFMTTGYALFPLIILRIVNIFLSNYFTLDESFFYHAVNVVGYVLMFTMLFMGIRSIHEYSILRTISTILLTVLAMTVIVFLALLAMSLAQQISVFIETIIKELNLRL